MYGLVNQAVEGLVRRDFGDAAWEQIKADANLDVDVFISNESYDDSLTYKLVASATKVLGVDATTVLTVFGRYWVLTTARESYGELLMVTGRSLPDFLHNLPNLHSRVTLLYRRLRPPIFRVEQIGDSKVHVHYQSHRAGLEAFVVGLLEGLGQLFETPCAVRQLGERDEQNPACTFEVTW